MKKIITISLIVLVVLGFGFFLFRISPQQAQQSPGEYNSALNVSSAKQLSAIPAFDAQSDHFQGNAKAKNVFVEYADFQCPACAVASEMLKEVPSKFSDTVFVFRYFPLVQIHPNSVESAVAVEAAGAQGKYWEMHDLVFKKQSEWENLNDPLDMFAQYAQTVGVADINQFKNDVVNKKYLSAIQKNSDEALGMGLQGTPTYFFNGHELKPADLNGLLAQAQQFLK